MMNQIDREQLHYLIQQVSFVVDDVQLYLDTHPCDKEALQYYSKYRDIQEAAYMEYARRFGPLRESDVYDECVWTWIDCPWPWKGEI